MVPVPFFLEANLQCLSACCQVCLPRSRISQLMGVEYQFDLMLSTDGSGRGAALVAAVLKTQPDSKK